MYPDIPNTKLQELIRGNKNAYPDAFAKLDFMTPNDFAVGLVKSVVDEGVGAYENMFTGAMPEQSSDPYGRRALTFFHSLTSDQKSIFFDVLRQVGVDTVSSVLGIIDGVGFIEGASDEFKLLYGEERLSGDLQSLFLVEDERRIR